MPPIKSSNQIRSEFLDFFREKGHEIVPSASLVPHNDPTLLFTNAGMNQFKDVFLGTGSRPYVRAADTQKCLRVSGKHNDLEEVGHDTYHHTLFEMLGNWSFGDYFKKEAIGWAWELLVGRWGLAPDRLYATVHEGDAELGLEPDHEAAAFWRSETTIPHDHILDGHSRDNFWMMGDTGPCGPCSEIHVDLRPDAERAQSPGAALVNTGDPRVMEIWNLVFIQYNALSGGGLEPLAAQHVDTGMGFERIVAVLQQKGSNYDTDLFAPLLEQIAALSPRADVAGYEALALEDEVEEERMRVAMRVVADHIRTIAFAVADGATPGNTGRGYVIRRILRRAVRYGYQTLGFREPFLYKLVEPLKQKMGDVFPELERQQSYIERVITAEEEGFLQTLGAGIASVERLHPYIAELSAVEENPAAPPQETLQRLRADRATLDLLHKAYGEAGTEELLDRFSNAAARRAIPGEVAFLLHDTYGFPIDLTGLMAREVGLSVDMERYETLMRGQKERARAVGGFKVDQSRSDAWHRISEGDDSAFVGYDSLVREGAAIRAARTVEKEGGAAEHQLVLDATPFYAESGGQIGDTGTLQVGEMTLRVLDTQKQQQRIVHVVDALPDDLDAPVAARVDAARRARIQKHHTATHLLHAALRRVLGPHVAQKGSRVAPERLRFDFSHFERVSPEQLREVERLVNEAVQRNIRKQEERDVPIKEALERGAMALFGEKYGERVRVITFDPELSVELCGGAHVEASGEIGVFQFLSEGSVAAGVRRVEATVGFDALEQMQRERAELERIRGLFRNLARPTDEEVADLIAQTRRLEKELERVQRAQLAGRLAGMIAEARDVHSVRLVTGRFEGVDMEALRALGETLRERMGPGAAGVLGGVDPAGDKVYLVAVVSEDLLGRTKVAAGALVGALARKVGGGGGGRPALATAGGKQPERLDEALQAAEEALISLL